LSAKLSPLAGRPAPDQLLVDVPRLTTGIHADTGDLARHPDP
jgi:hypothetical protein